jgi:hypothetical protein
MPGLEMASARRIRLLHRHAISFYHITSCFLLVYLRWLVLPNWTGFRPAKISQITTR